MTNETMRQQWNDEAQVRNWPKRERVTTVITPALINAVAPKPGERILDVGCGGGLAAIEAARAVGNTGSVIGFDLSNGLVALATQRAAEASVTNVRFVAGDAQTDDISGGPFDAAMSQFGVMFFADPVAAFTNIRRHLKPDGRLAFACWQPAPKNAWFPIPILMKYATQPPAPAAGGGPPPGPFAFGDPAYVRGILEGAGFTGVRHEPLERTVTAPQDAMFGRDVLDTLRLEGNRAEEAWSDLQAHAASMRAGDGQVRMDLFVHLFTANGRGA